MIFFHFMPKKDIINRSCLWCYCTFMLEERESHMKSTEAKKSFEYSRSTKFYHYHIGKKFDVFKYKWKNLIREYWYILILGHKLEVYWRLSELKKKCWKHISFYYLPITSILVAKADFCEMFSNIKNSLMITVIAISN